MYNRDKTQVRQQAVMKLYAASIFPQHCTPPSTSPEELRKELPFEVVGKEASGRVDYAIKKVIDVVNEELIAITEENKRI